MGRAQIASAQHVQYRSRSLHRPFVERGLGADRAARAGAATTANQPAGFSCTGGYTGSDGCAECKLRQRVSGPAWSLSGRDEGQPQLWRRAPALPRDLPAEKEEI